MTDIPQQDERGKFVKGNTTGHRFKKGIAYNPEGKTRGHKNLMTVVRDLANEKLAGEKMTRFATLVCNSMDANKKLEVAIDKLDETDPGYKQSIERYQKSCTDLADFLLKSSGDFSTTVKNTSDESQREFSKTEIIDGEEVTVLT